MFFIDTCYSGGVMGSVRSSGFVNDLASAENGAVVFTASSAGQLPQENDSWGNGAFTKSVVEGLFGKADAFNSGFVTVKGLGLLCRWSRKKFDSSLPQRPYANQDKACAGKVM